VVKKNLPAKQKTQVRSLRWEDSLKKEMATHSSILTWEIQGQRSVAGYSPWGRKRAGHDLATKQQGLFREGGGGLVAKLCPTLATPWTVACQPPLSIQARIMEWVAISFSIGEDRRSNLHDLTSWVEGSLSSM